jgi:hypothetical protein
VRAKQSPANWRLLRRRAARTSSPKGDDNTLVGASARDACPACPDGFGQGFLGGVGVAGRDGEGIAHADVDA